MSAPSATPSYSTKQLADLAGVSMQTVQRWADAGLVKSWRTPGGHRRLDGASAEAFLQSLLLNAAPATASGEPAAGRTLTVLLVDDDQTQREMYALLIEQTLPQARVVQAADAIEALLQVGRERPQIIVTDILMPGMSGHELIGHLQASPLAGSPVIISISGASQRELAAMGKLPATVPVLYRPFDLERLGELLQAAADTVLGRRSR